ncbi:MAG: hypothetical protein IPP61_17505 [Cytophagaceae bacterium]|nr:hypothetical protein [Cytophagaceae bacterium]MBK9935992.1 hypothetical protein [Cytophagaceae bacterium]MBL0304124.1 hypothetical protein [Cytophagaceae bacterium]MBL0326933.1 hypothetical protein [Cytophagaceae bacterium]
MKNNRFLKIWLILFFSSAFCNAQTADSTYNISTFSGSVGFTNNGFSIIPTFSLNHSAFVASLAFKKKKFSFEPDIRMVPDAKNGGMLWWLRYQLVDNKKFGFRIGTHPAFTLIRRSDTEDGSTKEITEMLRFIAFEAVPSYQINSKLGLSAMYLQGNGLQKHGPQLTRVLFLNSAITDINLSKNLYFNIFPSVYFLYTDGYRGDYLTVTGALGHKKLPFTIQSTINQTFKSDVPGNKDFMWNVTLNYNFKKILKRIN